MACPSYFDDVAGTLSLGLGSSASRSTHMIDLDKDARSRDGHDVICVTPLAEVADDDALGRNTLISKQRHLIERELAKVGGVGRYRHSDTPLCTRRGPKDALFRRSDVKPFGTKLADDAGSYT